MSLWSNITLPRVYMLGFIISVLKNLFDHRFRGTKVNITLRGRDIDVSYGLFLVVGIVWPIMLLFIVFGHIIGFKRFRKIYDDWLERTTGTRPTWTMPDVPKKVDEDEKP